MLVCLHLMLLKECEKMTVNFKFWFLSTLFARMLVGPLCKIQGDSEVSVHL
jgi:hypothetical protein